MDDREQLKDVQSLISYTIGLVVMLFVAAVALAIAQAWWWAVFGLAAATMTTFEVRRLLRKKERIEQRLEPPRSVGGHS